MSTDASHPHRVILRGLPAVLACIQHHPKSLREIHASPKCVPSLSSHIIALEAQGVKLHTSSASEMSYIAGTDCDDVCAITMRPEPGHVRVSDFSEWRESHETVVIADHISRPADLAAIARSMAAFGLKRLLLSSGSENIAFNSDTWTLAQGAMEHVRIMRAAALGGLLKLVKDKCCVVGLTSNIGRKIDLGTPVRVPGRHIALVLSGNELDPDLQPRIEHTYRFPGLVNNPALSLTEAAPIAIAWIASTPQPREDGFLARKRARHTKSPEIKPPTE